MLIKETHMVYNPRMSSMNVKNLDPTLMTTFRRWCGFHSLTLRAGVIFCMEEKAKELEELDRQHRKAFPDHPLDKEKPGD